MKRKVLIDPRRKRRVPSHFSWIDHRIVRNGFTRKCKAEDLGLYLFLVTVSDSEGLSFYGDRKLSEELNCPEESVVRLRSRLISAGLIAYRDGIYQVLELGIEVCTPPEDDEFKDICTVSDALAKLLGGQKNG